MGSNDQGITFLNITSKEQKLMACLPFTYVPLTRTKKRKESSMAILGKLTLNHRKAEEQTFPPHNLTHQQD
jgi:hypothetical protein